MTLVDCPHREWVNPDSRLMRCVDCGVAWPGHQLPTPAHHREGYGELANQPSWTSRVDAMVSSLEEVPT